MVERYPPGLECGVSRPDPVNCVGPAGGLFRQTCAWRALIRGQISMWDKSVSHEKLVYSLMRSKALTLVSFSWIGPRTLKSYFSAIKRLFKKFLMCIRVSSS